MYSAACYTVLTAPVQVFTDMGTYTHTCLRVDRVVCTPVWMYPRYTQGHICTRRQGCAQRSQNLPDLTATLCLPVSRPKSRATSGGCSSTRPHLSWRPSTQHCNVPHGCSGRTGTDADHQVRPRAPPRDLRSPSVLSSSCPPAPAPSSQPSASSLHCGEVCLSPFADACVLTV